MDCEALAKARAEFDAIVADVRPQLLRYCARMTGSAVDGEDIVQDALAKVYFRLPRLGHVENVSVPSIKGALHRGRASLRRQAGAGATEATPPLSTEQPSDALEEL